MIEAAGQREYLERELAGGRTNFEMERSTRFLGKRELGRKASCFSYMEANYIPYTHTHIGEG